MKRVLRKLPLIVIVGVLVVGLVFAFQPKPVAVDLTHVERGELIVTVDQDGKTRIKQRYVVAAPIGGRLQRIRFKPGDSPGATLAVIEPPNPMLLDPRSRKEAKDRIDAAESRKEKAKTDLGRAQLAESFARDEHERQKALGPAASKQELAGVANREETAIRERIAAEFGVKVADFELRLARTALDYTNGETPSETTTWQFQIPSPEKNVKVLKVLQESETVVAPGALLLEVGDPSLQEAEIDVLTTDAVKIKRDCKRVELVNWGGGKEILHGTVRLVEPSGFMKPSALGVEEQRVNVIVDFKAPDVVGENYRVVAKFVIWEGKDVKKVKRGAVFNTADGDAVYLKVGDRAVKRKVTVGEKNNVEVQIIDGLEEGDEVVLHPGDRVKDGVLIAPREKE